MCKKWIDVSLAPVTQTLSVLFACFVLFHCVTFCFTLLYFILYPLGTRLWSNKRQEENGSLWKQKRGKTGMNSRRGNHNQDILRKKKNLSSIKRKEWKRIKRSYISNNKVLCRLISVSWNWNGFACSVFQSLRLGCFARHWFFHLFCYSFYKISYTWNNSVSGSLIMLLICT